MNSDNTPARPFFRRLAIGVGIICLPLSLAFLWVTDEKTRLFGMMSCGFVAFVMFTIGFTGQQYILPFGPVEVIAGGGTGAAARVRPRAGLRRPQRSRPIAAGSVVGPAVRQIRYRGRSGGGARSGQGGAGKSTLNRLELTRPNANQNALQEDRFGQQGGGPLLVDLYIQSQPRQPQRIVLDLDATDDPAARPAGRALLSRLLRRLLLSAAVHLRWRACCARGCGRPTSMPRRGPGRGGTDRGTAAATGRRCRSCCAPTRASAGRRSWLVRGKRWATCSAWRGTRAW